MSSNRLVLNADRGLLLDDHYWNGTASVPEMRPVYEYETTWQHICDRLTRLHRPSEQRLPAPLREAPQRREGRSTRTAPDPLHGHTADALSAALLELLRESTP